MNTSKIFNISFLLSILLVPFLAAMEQKEDPKAEIFSLQFLSALANAQKDATELEAVGLPIELKEYVLRLKKIISQPRQEAFKTALTTDDEELIRYTLKNLKPGELDELLISAIREENAKLVEQLVQRGANVNALTFSRSQTALGLAAEKGNYPIVKFLIDHGADFNSGVGEGVFSSAILGRNLEILRLLQSLGAERHGAGMDFNFNPIIY